MRTEREKERERSNYTRQRKMSRGGRGKKGGDDVCSIEHVTGTGTGTGRGRKGGKGGMRESAEKRREENERLSWRRSMEKKRGRKDAESGEKSSVSNGNEIQPVLKERERETHRVPIWIKI